MSNDSAVSKKEKLHSVVTNTINDLLISFQDDSASVQAKDAFWFAFEYARSNTDSHNIQAAWEQYKESRDNVSD